MDNLIKHNTSKKPSKLILANIEWYNAGLFVGKQGYLRERFYELFTKHDDFLEAMSEIRKEPKYQIEIAGLTDYQRRSWLIGFFNSINQGGE
jgi:hypothetical protein